MRYGVIFEQTDTGYSAYVPDLPGCIAAGDTIDETAQLMREAIEMHLEAITEDGLPIPTPSTVVRDIEISTAA